MKQSERGAHERVCRFTNWVCTLGCSEAFLLREKESHLRDSHGVVACPACDAIVEFSLFSTHELQFCPTVEHPCPLLCGQAVKVNVKLVLHFCYFDTWPTLMSTVSVFRKFVCPNRLVHCMLECGLEIREVDRQAHEKIECINRPVCLSILRSLRF
jgi:hypothetical protein